ncbi:MAG: hypothetical protein M9939_22850 [Mesorhizobium sp.]|nr:hypothetical protein [Mesorhizobium sp.]MCO5163958.1 hypothetical protein [Mesorhizobium sp.]
MGVLVKYVVEDDGGNIITSSYLPRGYEDDDAAAVHIDVLRSSRDVSGYDAKHGRWWARDRADPQLWHYWWVECPKPAEN